MYEYKIIYSFYTKNNTINNYLGYINKETAYSIWTLSVLQSLKFFKKVELETDDFGYEILIKNLKLPFTKVTLNLNKIPEKFENIWTIGKIYTYKNQLEPFIHIDLDYILYNNFNKDFLKLSIGTEHKENLGFYSMHYKYKIENINKNFFNLPINWNKADYGVSLGIYLCNNLFFNEYYINSIFNIIENNDLSKIDLKNYSFFLEQYLFSCTLEILNIPSTSLGETKLINAKNGYHHYWKQKRINNFYIDILNILNIEYNDYYNNLCDLLKINIIIDNKINYKQKILNTFY